MKKFEGKVLFLDKKDINTDEIIPAKYLTEITKEALKPFLLEDLKLDNFNPKTDIKDKAIIVTKENFGCGSSREHAPWALEINGINVVISESFARIFRQNMYNCGMMAIELPKNIIEEIFKKYKDKKTDLKINLEKSIIEITADGQKDLYNFNISEFDRTLVLAGGWLEYADKKY